MAKLADEVNGIQYWLEQAGVHPDINNAFQVGRGEG
jgi:hypothetical protein